MKNFLVIDGNSIMNRAFYGLSNLRMFSKTARNSYKCFICFFKYILDDIR